MQNGNGSAMSIKRLPALPGRQTDSYRFAVMRNTEIKMRGPWFVMLIALVCAGCTHVVGKDFQRPDGASLVLGKTTKSEVVALYGPPDSEQASVSSGGEAASTQPKSEFYTTQVSGSYSTINYRYSVYVPPVLAGGSANFSGKAVSFFFHDGTIFGYNFSSDMKTDSSNFDETKLAALEKGKSTEVDVRAILGAPSGEAIYPAVLKQGQKKWLYVFQSADLSTRKILLKRLVVLFNEQGRLQDFQFGSQLANLPPPQPSGGGAPVPIFIPTHK